MNRLLKRVGLVVVALILTIDIFATDVATVEKLLNEYEKLQGVAHTDAGNELMQIFYEEKLADAQLKFSAKDNTEFINQQIWYWASEYFYSHQKYSLALNYALKSLPLCNKDEEKANCLSLISLVYFRQSNYNQAAIYAKQCYELDEKTGDPDIMSSSLNTLAGIYIGANQPKEAEQYILKGIEMAKKANNPARMSVLQGMASEVYHALGNNDEALNYIDKAIVIEQQLKNEDKMMVRLSQKASILIGLHNYKEAEQLLNKAIPFLKKVGNMQSYAIACNKMGMVLLCEDRKTEAATYFRLATDVFVEIGDIRNEMHSRKGLYESLWDSNSDSAKYELEQFNILKDSLYNIASAESMARFNVEFGTDWLQHENDMQKAKMQNVIIIGSIILILVVCGVWFIMHRRWRLREDALQAIIKELQPQKEENNTSLEVKVNEVKISVADQELLSQLVSIVTENMMAGNLSIEELASKMCITRGQLNRRIKSITGVTTQQYVLRIRLERARLLLCDNLGMPISEVAYNCGFEDATSFSRAFRRTFGESPSHYRNETQNSI